MTSTIHTGDCREILPTIPDESIDSVVCDPPYELGFMGKAWDSTGVAYDPTVWAEVLRVLKPGGHLLAFGGTRTYHRLTVAVEDAGFEIRDCLSWLYGSGFPKSHNVSKAINKAAGVTARQWDGWGTALKPAWEPIVVARKPLDGTVATNILEHGTGALNIDGCRVGDTEGRWPANLILTHHPDCQPAGTTSEPVGGGAQATSGFATGYEHGDGWTGRTIDATVWDCHPDCPAAIMDEQADSGASRYFTQTTPDLDGPSFHYQPKANKQERNAGLDNPNPHPTIKPVALMQWLTRLVTPPAGTTLDPFMGSGTTGIAATLERLHFIGIEQDPHYATIAETRIRHHNNQPPPPPQPATPNQPHNPTLF
jgi:DNA modification methylase